MARRKKPIDNENGAAMIMVLCIMMVFLALSLSVLLAASVMQGTAKKTAISERCKTAALSYSQMVEQQLVGGETVISSNDANSLKELYKELVLREGAAGVHDQSKATDLPEITTLTLGINGDSTSKVLNGYKLEMEVYWEGDTDAITSDIAGALTALDKEKAYHGLTLYVDVICRRGKDMYKIRSIYSVTVGESVKYPGSSEWGYQLGGRE